MPPHSYSKWPSDVICSYNCNFWKSHFFPIILKLSSLSSNYWTQLFQRLGEGVYKHNWTEHGPAPTPLSNNDMHRRSVLEDMACCHPERTKHTSSLSRAHVEGSAWHINWPEAILTDGHRWWQRRNKVLYIQQLQGPPAMASKGSGVCKTCMATVKKACTICGLD